MKWLSYKIFFCKSRLMTAVGMHVFHINIIVLYWAAALSLTMVIYFFKQNCHIFENLYVAKRIIGYKCLENLMRLKSKSK